MSKLSDEALSYVIGGYIKDADGAAIGRLITDPQKQLAAAKTFEKQEPSTQNDRFRLAGLVANSGLEKDPGQANLFDKDGITSLAEKMLAILKAADGLVGRDKNIAKSLLKNAERIDKNKLGTVDEQESAKQRDELAMIQARLNSALYKGPEADHMRNKIIPTLGGSVKYTNPSDIRRAAEKYIEFLVEQETKPPAKTEDTPIAPFTDSDTVQTPEKKKGS